MGKELKAKARKREMMAKEARAKRLQQEHETKVKEIMHKKHASPAAKEKVKAKENKSKKILDHKQSVLHAIVQAAHHLTHKEAGTKHDKKHAEHLHSWRNQGY